MPDLDRGIDCDDGDDDTSPAMSEICGNGVDDDCDGYTDDSGLGAPTWYPDRDGDGYAADAPVQACAQPAKHLATLGAVDCDDTLASVNPGAIEAWYDGIDQDCAGDSDYDLDGDGFDAKAYGGTDCDDVRAGVNPDADELCANGRDDDCDGATDDAGLGAVTWYPDLDQDGFAVDAPVQACARPAKHLAALGAIDCNDLDSAVKPGAVETWYDGTDQDCGADDDFDRDGDGFRSAAEAIDGTDCEDAIAAVNPDADEVCDNGLDDDCDGTGNGCELTGSHDVAALASSTITQTNSSLGPFGNAPFVVEATGDGLPDVVTGGYSGSVWIFRSPIGPTATQTGAYGHFRVVNDSNWRSAAVGDFNNDGATDLVLGRQEARDARVFYGPLEGYFEHTEADVVITDPTSGTKFGASVCALPDLDGDGHDEIVIGADGVAPSTPPAYYTFDGPYASGWTVANRIGRLYGRLDFDGTGWRSAFAHLSPSEPGMLASAHGDEGYTGTLAWLSASTLTGDTSFQSRAIVLGVEQAAMEAYSFDAADFDGDGDLDLVVGAPTADAFDGRAYVLDGPFSTALPASLADAYFVVSGTSTNAQVGVQTSLLDFDGDGTLDLAVGSMTVGVAIFYGPLGTGDATFDDADLRITGAEGRFGVGDLNQDGRDDLVLLEGSTTLHVVRGHGR